MLAVRASGESTGAGVPSRGVVNGTDTHKLYAVGQAMRWRVRRDACRPTAAVTWLRRPGTVGRHQCGMESDAAMSTYGGGYGGPEPGPLPGSPAPAGQGPGYDRQAPEGRHQAYPGGTHAATPPTATPSGLATGRPRTRPPPGAPP